MAVVVAKGWTRPVVFTQPPPAIISEQLSFFPRKSVIELPKTGGADLYQFVIADNDKKYYLKLDPPDRYARASELLCYRLAQIVGIPVPRCDFIQTFNGDIAFGSEDIAGVAARAETTRYLQLSSVDELGISLSGLQAALSAIHTLDIFVNNVDRHYSNFLVHGSGDERTLIALDFARSMFWDWPLVGWPASDQHTSEVWMELRERHGFDLTTALSVVDRLGIISPAQLSAILAQMPTHWLPARIRDEFNTYCSDGGWKARVDALRRGLEDGSIV